MNENEYTELPGALSVKFSADDLDLLQVGFLGTYLHAILNQAAISTLQVHDAHNRGAGRATVLKFIPQNYERSDVLVKARLKGLRQGSIELDIAAVVAQVFSQPGAVSLLSNLLSNAIWAIGVYAARVSGVYVNWKKGRDLDFAGELIRPEAGRKRMRPKIVQFVRLLAESSNGGKLRLKTDQVEFEIEFNPKNRSLDEIQEAEEF